MTDPIEAHFRDDPPTITSMFGEQIGHPEFVGVQCAECGRYGYVHEDNAWAASKAGVGLVCDDCGTGGV